MKRLRWRLILRVILLAALGLLCAGGPVLSDKGIVPPELERAIQEKGLSWTPRAYDRDFALGLLFLPEEQRAPQKEAKSEPKLSQLAAIDWRNKGGNFVSPVKDQEDCGSCWAFASVAALESGIAMAENTPGSFLNLSEQILVSCESNSDGCNGGYIYYASVFLQNQGTALESCFPYCACDASCSNACANWQASARRISNYTPITRSVNALRAALANGPVVTGFYVCTDFANNYGSGVYEYAWGVQEGGHAVLIVGYVDNTSGQYGGGYFIVKNSWGTGWGESGYFRIGYSQVTNSMVQFGTDSYQYQVSGGGGGGVCNATRSIACGGSDDRNNGGSGSTNQIASYPCAFYDESGPEYAYRFVPTVSGDVEVSLSNLTDDLDLFVLDGAGGKCAPANCIVAGTNGGLTDYVAFDAVAGHTYYLVVDGYSGAVSNYHIAVSCCSHPATPSLTAPTNGGTTNDNTPSFRWGATAGADSYQIQVDDDAGFPSPLVDTEVTTTSYTPDSGWGTGTYYWRVRGHNTSCNLYGGWSSTWSVTVVIGGAPAFDAPTRWLAAFGYSAGGWKSQNLFPRAVGDVNGDGREDVVGFASDGVYVSLSTGGGLGAASRWLAKFGTTHGWTNQDTYPRCVGDVNGDGKADVVGFFTDGVYVSLSTGTSFAAPSRWIARYGVTYGWTSQNLYPRLLGDVNNDGKADVVGFYRDGVYVSLSTGTGFGASVRWIAGFGTTAGGWASQDKYPRCVADVNGDGRADVVGFGNAGASVSLSTGTAFGASSRWIAAFGYNTGGWTSQDKYPRCVADVNGDSLADVVGFGKAGAYVSLSTGTSFGVPQLGVASYGYSAGGWTSQDKYPRTLGDVNGDGRADIVGFGNAGTYVSLSRF